MGMQELTAKILSDAAAEAAQTLENARERAKLLQNQSAGRIQSQAEDALQRATKDADEAHERAIKMAQLDHRKQMLATKRARMDDAFEEALKLLVAMPEKQKKEFFQKLLEQNAQGGEELCAVETEKAVFTQAFLQPFGVTLAKQAAQGSGGFVLVRQGVEIDCTYEAMLRASKDDLEPQAAQVLFARLEEAQA